MILVLADDLAGAAEMGGMAWRHGLSAEVRTGAGLDLESRGSPDTGVDVLVLDTNTRSCDPREARRRMHAVAAHCQQWAPRGVYKKVDSVLRGPVAAELDALLDALGFERCLLVPANPGLGRVISGGQYLLHGVPLHETDFRLDPEYPATTADVLARVATSGADAVGELSLRAVGETLPERGIVVGEAACAADLASWAALAVRVGVLAAGASEFFGAYLKALGHPPAKPVPESRSDGERRDLFVCGSTSAGSREFCRKSEARGVPVVRLPKGLLRQPAAEAGAEALVNQWGNEIVAALSNYSRVVAAIDRPLCLEPGMPQVLGEYLGAAVEQALARIHVERLFAEGGATAAALVRRMGWTCLRVRREWATGVVTCEVHGQDAPLVSMKPGSYAWSAAILD